MIDGDPNLNDAAGRFMILLAALGLVIDRVFDVENSGALFLTAIVFLLVGLALIPFSGKTG